jgi:hypothetical protein
MMISGIAFAYIKDGLAYANLHVVILILSHSGTPISVQLFPDWMSWTTFFPSIVSMPLITGTISPLVSSF